MNSRLISIAMLVGLMAAVPTLCAQEVTVTSEIIATKLRADGFTYKSRASANLILMSCDDPAAWQAVVPDSVANNGRAYPVKQICDSAFSRFACLHQLTLPRWLENVSPGMLKECPALRVLILRSPVPPAFVTIDGVPCRAADVFDEGHFLRTVLVVPPGCEQVYRRVAGWGAFRHIVSHTPTLDELGMTPADMERVELQSELKRVQNRKARVITELEVLRQVVEQ